MFSSLEAEDFLFLPRRDDGGPHRSLITLFIYNRSVHCVGSISCATDPTTQQRIDPPAFAKDNRVTTECCPVSSSVTPPVFPFFLCYLDVFITRRQRCKNPSPKLRKIAKIAKKDRKLLQKRQRLKKLLQERQRQSNNMLRCFGSDSDFSELFKILIAILCCDELPVNNDFNE